MDGNNGISKGNIEFTLGRVTEALDHLTKSQEELKEVNSKEHEKIFARLEEGDKYLFVFKASRCTFDWLNRNGLIKWGLSVVMVFLVGWVARGII